MSTSATTLTAPERPARRVRPLLALAKAEFLQFRRNRTLLFMGTVFPIGLPLAMFFLARAEDGTASAWTGVTLEMFANVALLFVQYYSVLSMVTTRRGEGVLKRLRTGEATDWQILAAPAVPGAILTGIGAVIISAVVYTTGGPAPVNLPLMLLALVAGLVVFSALALLTATYTKDPEAAQVTSLPVIAIAVLGMGSIRGMLPERYAAIADYSPFAGVSDLLHLGAVGRLGSDPASTAALDVAGTFEQMVSPLAILVAWTVIALVLVRRSFRWDDRG